MGNIATTINQQIETLEKREMVLDLQIEKIKEILLDLGYYRLGFY
jgi:abortive infection bacteriophage resistance protein